MKVTSLIFLLLNIYSSYPVSFEDFCEAGDNECIHPGITELGKTALGQCIKNKTLVRLQIISFLKCVKECMKTSGCTSVSYRRMWKLCDLNGGEYLEEELVEDNGCLHSNISSWPILLGDKCRSHTCEHGMKCVVTNGLVECKLAYCTGDPEVPNTKTLEKFGIHRTIGHGVNYACMDGFKMCGRPFAVCQDTGSWKPLFYCTEPTIVSCGKPTIQSSNYNTNFGLSGEAVDGIKSSGFFHTAAEINPWWYVDLTSTYKVAKVVVLNRRGSGYRLRELKVHVGSNFNNMQLCGQFTGQATDGQVITINCNSLPTGRYVKLTSVTSTPGYFHLTEVEVHKYVL